MKEEVRKILEGTPKIDEVIYLNADDTAPKGEICWALMARGDEGVEYKSAVFVSNDSPDVVASELYQNLKKA